MKRLLITLEVQDGERRHTHRVLHTTNGNNIEFAAQRYAASYWGYATNDDDWWWVQDIAIRVKMVKELSEYEYRLMSDLFAEGNVRYNNYFKIVHAGWCEDSQREEIQIHAGEHGNVFLFQDDDKLGFIVDAYGQTDHVATMQVWEEDLAPPSFTPADVQIFIKNWGQTHEDICSELGYDPADADDPLMMDYFWSTQNKMWFPKSSSLYSEIEQEMADTLRRIG